MSWDGVGASVEQIARDEAPSLSDKLMIADLRGGAGTISAVETLLHEAADVGNPFNMLVLDYAAKMNIGRPLDTSGYDWLFTQIMNIAQNHKIALLTALQIDKATENKLESGDLTKLEATHAYGGIAAVAHLSCAFTLHQKKSDRKHVPPLLTCYISHSRICQDKFELKLVYQPSKQFIGELAADEVPF